MAGTKVVPAPVVTTPNERRIIPFNFADDLGVGVTVDSFLSVSVSPAGLSHSNYTPDGQVAKVLVYNGAAGATYSLDVRIMASTGEHLEARRTIVCKALGDE